MLEIDDITKHIKDVQFTRMWKKTTICLITLDNGFEVVWSSACVDENNFDEVIWQNEAKWEAMDKLRELYWFAQHLYTPVEHDA